MRWRPGGRSGAVARIAAPAEPIRGVVHCEEVLPFPALARAKIDSRGGQAIVEQIEFVAVAPPFDDLSHDFIPARPSHGFIPMPDALRAAIYQCVASIVV